MAVYAEWWWLCQFCDDQPSEPFGNQYDAEADLETHMREAHPELEGTSDVR